MTVDKTGGKAWHRFETGRGYRQLRPPLGKWVVVRLAPKPSEQVDFGVKLKPGLGLTMNYPPGFALAYRKDGGGDKSCPYFVIRGIGGTVTHWCDCLPEGFDIPNELLKDGETA